MKTLAIKKINFTLKNFSIFINFLLIFSIVIDPTNILFGIKDLSFLLFLLVSLPYIDFKKIYIPLVFILVYLISLSFGLLFDNKLDYTRVIGYLKSFLFLIYVFWMDKCVFLNTFRFFYFSTLVMAVIEIILFIIFTSLPDSATLIYQYFMSNEAVIMVSKRTFLGINFQSVYYRSSSCVTLSIPAALIAYFKTHKKKYFFQSIMLISILFISATRANMLSALLIIAGILLFYILYYKKNQVLFVALFVICAFSAFILIFALLTENDPSSMGVKAGHQKGYIELFMNSPLKYFLIGGGPGEYFYSYGFQRFASYTELSYYDLIKNYGLIFTLTLLCLMIIPIFQISNNRNMDKLTKISFIIGYFAYLFIAGTNPLLISSNGFIIFSLMFYISNKNFEEIFGRL